MKARFLLLVLLFSGCTTLRPAPDPSRLADELVAAINSGDGREVAALFEDNATAYLPFGDARLLAGRSAIEESVTRLIHGQKGSMKAEGVRSERLGRHLALVTFGLQGAAVTSRRTIVARYSDGRWLIVHLHASNIRAAE